MFNSEALLCDVTCPDVHNTDDFDHASQERLQGIRSLEGYLVQLGIQFGIVWKSKCKL